MEIYEMFSCSFDVSSIWKLDIFFLKFDIEYFSNLGSDSMLIESTEYFFSFSSE